MELAYAIIDKYWAFYLERELGHIPKLSFLKTKIEDTIK